MKIGIDQVRKPAPLWFRRLRDGAVNFLLPALGQLITSLKLTDEQANMWLQVLTFLPAAFNFFGVMLGDDVKRKIRVWALLVGISALLSGCSTSAEIAADRAKAAAIKQEKVRKERLIVLQQVRKELPCVPIKIVQGITRYLPGDSIPCTSGKCPPAGVRVDTSYILDAAALQSVRDSLDQAIYLNGLKDAHILQLQAEYSAQLTRANNEAADKRYWRNKVLWAIGVVSGGGFIWLLFAGKLSFISKIFTWLISKLR